MERLLIVMLKYKCGLEGQNKSVSNDKHHALFTNHGYCWNILYTGKIFAFSQCFHYSESSTYRKWGLLKVIYNKASKQVRGNFN